MEKKEKKGFSIHSVGHFFSDYKQYPTLLITVSPNGPQGGRKADWLPVLSM